MAAGDYLADGLLGSGTMQRVELELRIHGSALMGKQRSQLVRVNRKLGGQSALSGRGATLGHVGASSPILRRDPG